MDQAQQTPTRELYTDSLVKLSQATGELQWYYQAFPNDFHDWDLQVSPIFTTAAGHSVVLAAGKGGFVFAFDPSTGTLLWKTSVGMHNGHDDDGQLALDGKLQLTTPYTCTRASSAEWRLTWPSPTASSMCQWSTCRPPIRARRCHWAART